MVGNGNLAGPFCALCGKVLGVYEPLILIGSEQQVTRTSRLKHPHAPQSGVIVHESCYERRQPWSEERST